MKSKQLILLGPPGADINAQAIALSERWHVPYVSVSSLLHEAVAQETDIGLAARRYLEQGSLVPDEWVMLLLRRRVEQLDMLDGWVLTGFPRSLPQARAFDELLAKFQRPAVTVAYCQVTTGILINRLSAETSENVTTVRDRLAQYQAQTAPLLKYYRQRACLTRVNGNRSAAEVANELAQLGEEESGAARFLQDETELNALLAKASVVVVDCIASWCGPCKQVTPLIDRLAETYGEQVAVVKLDFDNNRQVAKRFGLKGMPAVMFFKGGELIETLTGVKAYQVYRDRVESLR